MLPVVKMALLTDYHFNILLYTYNGPSKSNIFIYPKINTKNIQNVNYSLRFGNIVGIREAYILCHEVCILVSMWTIKKAKYIFLMM